MALLNPYRLAFFATLAIALYYGWKPQEESRSLNRRSVAIATYCNQQGLIAMTFDAGVHTAYTPSILNALKATGIQGTFHISGEYLTDLVVVNIIKRIISEGHTVGMFYNGPDALGLNQTQLTYQLNSQATRIKNAVGVMPKFVRTKLGSTTPISDDWIASAGFIQTRWSIDLSSPTYCANGVSLNSSAFPTFDAALQVFQNVGGSSKGTFIALLTDLCDFGATITSIVPYIQKKYQYNFVPLETCLGVSGKYLGQNPEPPVTYTSTQSAGSPPGTSTGGGNTIPTNFNPINSVSSVVNSVIQSTSTPKSVSAAPSTVLSLFSFIALSLCLIVLSV